VILEIRAHLPFTVVSDAENQVVILEWIPKNGIKLINGKATQQIELIDKEHISQDLYFTASSAAFFNTDKLFTFNAKNRNTDKQLLVNGKPEFTAGVQFMNSQKKLHLVVTDLKGT